MSLTKLTKLVVNGIYRSRTVPAASFSLSPANMAALGNSSDSLVVEHDPKKKKFFITLGSVDEAKLEYVKEKQNSDVVLNMWHTEVPPKLQGKGIAKLLAKEAFEYAIENNLKMRLTCPYLQKYLNDNPLEKYKAAVV